MRITYIDHSGFLVETGTANFIFDYYKGEIPPLDVEIPLVVFASHKHPDHYNPVIFDWMNRYRNVTFILDKDCGIKWKLRECEKSGIPLGEHLVRVKRDSNLTIPLANGKDMELRTLRSTDEGVAFLIRYEGKTIYHAGDLNDWIWKEESDSYNMNMEKSYRREMEKLSDMVIDVAFVPMDPRQKEKMYRGMEIFLQHARPAKVFPMHFWGKYSIIQKFCEIHPEYADQIMCIRNKGEQFEL